MGTQVAQAAAPKKTGKVFFNHYLRSARFKACEQGCDAAALLILMFVAEKSYAERFFCCKIQSSRSHVSSNMLNFAKVRINRRKRLHNA